VDQEDRGDHNPTWCTRTGFYILLMEAVGFGEGSRSYVGEGGDYALFKGVGSGFGSGSTETS